MWLVMCGILITLLGITFQDFKTRSVYTFWFPALILFFGISQALGPHAIKQVGQSLLINMGFLILQFLMVSIYFSVKYGYPVNLTSKLLGWGDILLLICLTFYLSVLNFLLFYIISLVVTLICWFIWLKISNTKDKRVPLAGFQAAFLAIYLIGDWMSKTIDITSDTWLLSYLNR